MIATWVPGDSPLHRCPAGVKLALLAVGVTALALTRSPAATTAGLLLVAVLALLARLPARRWWAQLRPVLWVVLLLAPFQWLAQGPRTAYEVCGTLVVAVVAATAVTLTTRTEALLAVVERVLAPLRRVGVAPERVALLLTVTLATVPVLAEVARQVADARRARGLQGSVRAFVVPLAVRTVRHAELLGEALAARGVDDPDDPDDPEEAAVPDGERTGRASP